MATAFAALMATPTVPLAQHATPVDRLARLRAALGPSCPELLMKRDDLLSFGGGGNKVRKLQTVARQATAAGADTLITCGGVQSNHARATAAAAAALGLRAVLVLNGTPPAEATGNYKLDRLFGAEVHFVPTREDRAPTMTIIADQVRAGGGKPFVVPLGASTPTGAMGFARGVVELSAAAVRPDAIVHASSSGGTQAGMIAGCALVGLRASVLGVSADDPATSLAQTIRDLLAAMASQLGAKPETIGLDRGVDVDDTQVGEGYGVPTPASIEARELVARTEGIVLDQTYTSKAMAGLIGRVRAGRFDKNQTVLFWHTGGLTT
ncbi:MAG TPA: pyridoxal-phosphate dependent enzyme [Vicinamibacterales bacterium]|nr:pyridoxal-phosphate dependent enzyme [Vicinamibacterales bacterium]